MALSLKQQLFVEAYLGEAKGNATEAARVAGYKNPRISGSENLTKPAILARISERVSEAAMPANEVLRLLSEQAFGSLEDFLDLGTPDARYPQALQGKVKVDIRKAAQAGKLRLLKTYKDSPKDGIEITLHDPQAALVHLGRHHKLFTDKVEHTGGDEFLQKLANVLSD
jgi:phage terminase small subunit